jgi:hypothetical protein
VIECVLEPKQEVYHVHDRCFRQLFSYPQLIVELLEDFAGLRLREQLESIERLSVEEQAGQAKVAKNDEYGAFESKRVIDSVEKFKTAERFETVEAVDATHARDPFAFRQSDGIFRLLAKKDSVLWRQLRELYVTAEYQSTCKYGDGARMFEYQLLLMLRLNRERMTSKPNRSKRRDETELPAILPVVVYNGKSRWTALIDSVVPIFKGANSKEHWQQVKFPYLLIDLK